MPSTEPSPRAVPPRRRPRRGLAVALALTATFAGPGAASADQIWLTNGRSIEGKVVLRDAERVVVRGRYGEMTLRARDVDRVVSAPTVEDLYEREAGLVEWSDPDDVERLATWCRERGLLALAGEHAAKAEALRAARAEARRRAEEAARALVLRTRREGVDEGDADGLMRHARWAAEQGYPRAVVDEARAAALRARRAAAPVDDAEALYRVAQWAEAHGYPAADVDAVLGQALLAAPEHARARVANELRALQADGRRDRQAAAQERTNAEAEHVRARRTREAAEARRREVEAESDRVAARERDVEQLARSVAEREHEVAGLLARARAEQVEAAQALARARDWEARAQASAAAAQAAQREAEQQLHWARQRAQRAACGHDCGTCGTATHHATPAGGRVAPVPYGGAVCGRCDVRLRDDGSCGRCGARWSRGARP